LIVNEERDSGNYKSALEYIKKINDLDLRLRLITGLINTNIDDETSSELDSSVDTIIKEITGFAECYKAVEIICEIAQKYAEFRKEDRGFSILKTLTETVNRIKDRRSKEIARWLIATSYANLGDFVNAKKVKPSRSTVDDKYGYFPAQIYIAATAVGYVRNGDYDKAMRVTREYNNRYKKSPYTFLVQMAAVGTERGDYDKAYSILETAYDTRWKDEHNYPQCNIITTPWEYHFRECPKWFLDVNRVDLAIKCLRFISSDRLGGSDTVEALMMIEKKRRETGYTLKDSDKAILRGIIRFDNLFASYNRNFIEWYGLNEVTIEI
jgi:tetratricopeptide (TPR) repeat protein